MALNETEQSTHLQQCTVTQPHSLHLLQHIRIKVPSDLHGSRSFGAKTSQAPPQLSRVRLALALSSANTA